MSIINHDFGNKRRQTVRRFRQSLSLDAVHEANILVNPAPYLERASERIYQLEKALFEAREAAKPPAGLHGPSVEGPMNYEDYQRLLNCRSIVDKAVEEFMSHRDEL